MQRAVLAEDAEKPPVQFGVASWHRLSDYTEDRNLQLDVTLTIICKPPADKRRAYFLASALLLAASTVVGDWIPLCSTLETSVGVSRNLLELRLVFTIAY